MGSGRKIYQRNAGWCRRSRMPLRVIGGWRTLWVPAIVLAAVATTAASSSALPPAPAGGVPRLHLVPSIVPNDSIVGLTLYSLVKPYTRGATKIGPQEMELDFGFGTGTVAVVVHFNRHGVIDGISSNYGRLRVYGKPLAIGFHRMAARLKRRGWREGICTRGPGHFAALGTADQPHTYIVWSGHHVTVAMSTVHSTFARTKADCPRLSNASAAATR
jgi:hypothetical protein